MVDDDQLRRGARIGHQRLRLALAGKITAATRRFLVHNFHPRSDLLSHLPESGAVGVQTYVKTRRQGKASFCGWPPCKWTLTGCRRFVRTEAKKITMPSSRRRNLTVWVLRLLVFACAVLFGLGITLPFVEFERLFVFSRAVSLSGLVESLWTGGDAGLAVVVGLFSIALPSVKLAILCAEVAGLAPAAGARWHWLLAHMSRWSLMDVMLVALAIFAVKTSGLGDAITQPGLWCYAASALLAGLLPVLSERYFAEK
ncbi:paraquat-inducible protein A [Rhizobium halophytocola]